MSEQETIPPGVAAAVLGYREMLVRARASFHAHCKASLHGTPEEAAETGATRVRDAAALGVGRDVLLTALAEWK
jgi:hypothetical protein